MTALIAAIFIGGGLTGFVVADLRSPNLVMIKSTASTAGYSQALYEATLAAEQAKSDASSNAYSDRRAHTPTRTVTTKSTTTVQQ